MTRVRFCLLVLAQGVGASDVASAQQRAPAGFRGYPVQEVSHADATRAAGTRIAAQIGGGALAAAVLGFAAWKTFDNPQGSDRRVRGDEGYTPNANTAFAVGSFVGSTVAAYVIGSGDGSRGSFAATVLGAAIPTISLVLGRDQPYLPLFGLVFGAPLHGIGATLGYQLTRRAP